MKKPKRETKQGKQRRFQIVLFLWRTYHDTGAWPLLADTARHIHLSEYAAWKHVERLRNDGVICAEYGSYLPLRLNLRRLERTA